MPGVERVHHLHAWSITQERPMAATEVEVADGTDGLATERAIKARLGERFGMEHATVEIDLA